MEVFIRTTIILDCEARPLEQGSQHGFRAVDNILLESDQRYLIDNKTWKYLTVI